MLIKTRGIVFRTKKYSETSIIADVFTEEKGLRSFIVSGVRTQRPKIGSGLFQVMTVLDLVAYYREDKDLSRLKEIKLHYVFKSIPFDVRKGGVGLFIVDIARKTIQGHEYSPELFAFLLGYLIQLDEAELFSNIHLHFLVNLTTHLGFQMGGNFDENTSIFDLQEGLFVKRQPSHPFWIKPELSSFLNEFLEIPLQNCQLIKLSRAERKALIFSLLDYYRLHIEHFPDVVSHLVLEEVLS